MLYKVFKQEKDETDEEYKQRKRGTKLHKGVYEQIVILSLTVKAEEQTLKEALEKLLEKVQKVGSDDTSELFQQMENILKTNEDIASTYFGGSDGIDAIYLLKYLSDVRKK